MVYMLTNIGGILMGSMLPYMAHMDPSWGSVPSEWIRPAWKAQMFKRPFLGSGHLKKRWCGVSFINS